MCSVLLGLHCSHNSDSSSQAWWIHPCWAGIMLKYRAVSSGTLRSVMESVELVVPARLVDVLLQSRLHLVVCQERHVAWVSHSQEVPVPQNWSPGLQRERNREEKKKRKQRDGGVWLSRVCYFTRCWESDAKWRRSRPRSCEQGKIFIQNFRTVHQWGRRIWVVKARSNDQSAPQSP